MTFKEWWVNVGTHKEFDIDKRTLTKMAWNAALESNVAQIKLGGQKPDTYTEDVYWYKCPKCNMQNVPGHHLAKYCPDCGTKIEWVEP